MNIFHKVGGFFTVCFLFIPKVAFASSFTTDLARESVEVTTMFSDVFRWLIWLVVKLGYNICYFFEKALNHIFDIAPNFTSITSNEFINRSAMLGIAFLSPILVWIGLKALTKQNHNIIKQTSVNLLVIASLITSLTMPIYRGKTLIPLLNDLTQSSINIFLEEGNMNLSKSLILDQLVDLKYVIDSNSNSQLNNIRESTFEPKYFNINTVLDSNEINKEYPVYNQSNGQWETQTLKSGWFGWFDESVYRYKLQDPFVLILSFLVLSLGFIFAGLKFLRLIFELTFKQILLPFIGLTDVENGQRFKKLLTSIATTFLLMVIVVIIFRCYQLAINWINSGFGLVNIEFGVLMYMKLLGYIAAVLMLLDGPKIVEELFGMDAGISGDAIKTTSHAMSLAKNTGMIGKGIGDIGSRIADTGKNIINSEPTQKVANSIKSGAENLYHFKGFDENGKAMSSKSNSEKIESNDSVKSQSNQSQPTQVAKSYDVANQSDNIQNTHSNSITDNEKSIPQSYDVVNQSDNIQNTHSNSITDNEKSIPQSHDVANQSDNIQNIHSNSITDNEKSIPQSNNDNKQNPTNNRKSLAEMVQTSHLRQAKQAILDVNQEVKPPQNKMSKTLEQAQKVAKTGVNQMLDNINKVNDVKEQFTEPIANNLKKRTVEKAFRNQLNQHPVENNDNLSEKSVNEKMNPLDQNNEKYNHLDYLIQQSQSRINDYHDNVTKGEQDDDDLFNS